MEDLQTLQDKYDKCLAEMKAFGDEIERLKKQGSEFGPKGGRYIARAEGGFIQNLDGDYAPGWNICQTWKDSERLAKIFQAVAEQFHLLKHVNGNNNVILTHSIYDVNGLLTVQKTNFSYILGSSPLFKSKEAGELAIKLASPNLQAYWRREI